MEWHWVMWGIKERKKKGVKNEDTKEINPFWTLTGLAPSFKLLCDLVIYLIIVIIVLMYLTAGKKTWTLS